MDEKRGLFIAFEGIDGCGKSTQIKKFARYLFDRGKHSHVVFTRNPYKDVRIREILRADDDPMTQAEKLAELFINDRRVQVERVIIPSLKEGLHVVTDRFKLSTISYQAAQGLDMNELIKKHEGMPVPDITFIIDVSAFVASQRMKKDSDRKVKEHKFEKYVEFSDKLRENYYKAKEVLKDEKIYIVNGERAEEEIFDEIVSIFERELREKGIEFD
mgnify:CR=1 FL=1